MPDHVHILFGLRPQQAVSDLLQDIKGSSSNWINKKKFVRKRFSWQEGFGAFSHSMSNINKVIDYIKNQEIHHQDRSFLDEYIGFLRKYDIPFEERYLFKPIDTTSAPEENGENGLSEDAKDKEQ